MPCLKRPRTGNGAQWCSIFLACQRPEVRSLAWAGWGAKIRPKRTKCKSRGLRQEDLKMESQDPRELGRSSPRASFLTPPTPKSLSAWKPHRETNPWGRQSFSPSCGPLRLHPTLLHCREGAVTLQPAGK